MRDSADQNLDETQFPRLNRRLYGQSPGDYFRFRLRLLLLMAGRPDDVMGLFEEGVAYNSLTMGGRPDISADQTDRFVAADAEVLWHHAAEALLRAYLAHRTMPPCPWLDIARLRSFGEFKGRVESQVVSLTNDDAGLQEVVDVFVGPLALEDCERAFREDVRANLCATVVMLNRIGERYLEYAHAYNAAKHGLAIEADHQGFSIAGPDGQPIIEEDGPALTYPEVRRTADGPTWHLTTSWVLTDQLMGSVFWIARLLDSMWSAATIRYVEVREPTVYLPTPEIVEELKMHPKKWVSVSHLPLPLAYWSEPDEDDR